MQHFVFDIIFMHLNCVQYLTYLLFFCVINFLLLLLYMEGILWGAIPMLAAKICSSGQQGSLKFETVQ